MSPDDQTRITNDKALVDIVTTAVEEGHQQVNMSFDVVPGAEGIGSSQQNESPTLPKMRSKHSVASWNHSHGMECESTRLTSDSLFTGPEPATEAIQDSPDETITDEQQLTFEEIQQCFDTTSPEFSSVANATEIIEAALGKNHPLSVGLPNTRRADPVDKTYHGKKFKKLQYICIAFAL